MSKETPTPHLKEQPRKILVISLPGIGDTINSTPVFKPLRTAFPEAYIAALVMYRPCKEVLETNPNIDDVIFWEFMKEGTLRSLRFILTLRKMRFDLSMLCYPANRAEYNLVSFLVGARQRLGHRYAHQSLRNLHLLNNRTIAERTDLHNVEENMRLLELAGVSYCRGDLKLSLTLEEADRAFASSFLTRIPEGRILVGMHAWSTTLKNMHRKCWPAENFALLAERLKEEYDCEILLFQGPHDEAVNRRIADQSRVPLHLVENTTVRQSAALMEKCDVIVTNDSGPMHIAAAAGSTIAAIFGPTDPLRLHPWSENYSVVRTGIGCSPCFYYSPRPLVCKRRDYACLTGLDVDRVHSAVREVLQRTKGRKGTAPESSGAG